MPSVASKANIDSLAQDPTENVSCILHTIFTVPCRNTFGRRTLNQIQNQAKASNHLVAALEFNPPLTAQITG